MRIDNWPLDRIMRLPDWCFGRRWWVGSRCMSASGKISYGMSEERLPDKFVVWGVLFGCKSPSCLESLSATIRLGDHMPVSDADGLTMERLFKNISAPPQLYEFFPQQNGTTWINTERMLIETAGRRICFLAIGDGEIIYEVTIGVMISALPKEVPDWLISGQASNLL